jgi:hypothetical protein
VAQAALDLRRQDIRPAVQVAVAPVLDQGAVIDEAGSAVFSGVVHWVSGGMSEIKESARAGEARNFSMTF